MTSPITASVFYTDSSDPGCKVKLVGSEVQQLSEWLVMIEQLQQTKGSVTQDPILLEFYQARANVCHAILNALRREWQGADFVVLTVTGPQQLCLLDWMEAIASTQLRMSTQNPTDPDPYLTEARIALTIAEKLRKG